MNPKFEVIFLEQAIDFMSKIDSKAKAKIYYNIDKAKLTNDSKLFKKLKGEIWEFRTKYIGLQYRLLAFWDKTDKEETDYGNDRQLLKLNHFISFERLK